MTYNTRSVSFRVATVTTAVLLGLGVAQDYGTLTFVMTASIMVLAFAANSGIRGQTVAASLVAVVIIGYVVLGRGFAHLGVSLGGMHIYVGEVALACGLFFAFGKLSQGVWKTVTWRLLLLLVLCTLPALVVGLVQWGFVAVRDYAMIYYVAFVPIGWVLTRLEPTRFVSVGKLALMLHVAYAAAYPFREYLADVSPVIDGIPLLVFRNDYQAILLLLFIFGVFVRPDEGVRRRIELGLVPLATALFFVLEVRAAMVAAVMMVVTLAIMGRWREQGFALAAVILILVVAQVIGLSVDSRRSSVSAEVNLGQVVEYSVDSVAGLLEGDSGGGTAGFRLRWWAALIDDMMTHPLDAVVGFGFGQSLAISEEFLVGDPEGTGYARSPHNGLLALAYRAGCIGAVMWLLAVGRLLIEGMRLGSKRAVAHSADVAVMTLGVVGLLVTGVFGVLLESPFSAAVLYTMVGSILYLTQARLSSEEREVSDALC